MAIDQTQAPAARRPDADHALLFCALTGKPISAGEAYWAPPLVTAGDLVRAIVRAGLTSPSALSHMLMDPQPDVPYAADARELLAARRSAEQLKLVVGLLLAVALVVLPLVLLMLR